jgi:hypothetical protein
MASYTYELIELGDDAHGLGCKCCRFSSGLDLPKPKDLSIDEIRKHGIKFSTSIIKDWAILHAVVKRFEAKIQKRWLKKGLKQRQQILLQAWPDMSKDHRPDFASVRNTKRAYTPRSRTTPSQAYLWPYINLEVQ